MSEHLNFDENGGPTSQENAAAAAVDHALHQLKASNKRKRDPSDHGGEHKHSGSKRTSSANNLNGNAHEATDMSRVLYPDNMPNASGSSQDFNALSQQLARHVASHGMTDNSTNPGSTAAAALAGIMPQLTVPQPTELSFVSTGSGTDADRQLDSSFDMGGDNGPNPNVQGSPYGMGGFQGTATQVPNARETSNGGPKPAVGSDEWHKVRRDNHKEGEPEFRSVRAWIDTRQWNDDVAKPSTRESTSWPRSSRGAKRTRVPYCNGRYNTSRSSERTRRRTLKNGRWRSC